MIKQKSSGASIDQELLDLPPEMFGRPKAKAGKWGSCLRVIDPVEASCTRLL